MEITSLASYYMDNVNLSAGSTVNGPESFAEILKRTHANQNASPSVEHHSSAPIDKNDKLYQLCLELETFVVKNLVTGMRNTVQKTGFIDDSFAGKMYEDMLYDEYAKDFTKNANFGLAEQAYRQLKNM